MKKSLLLGICILFSFSAAIAQQKIKDGTVAGTALPNKDALLELESANKGLLQARVALVQTTNPAPLTAHVAGMMVYNTATANDVSPGVYYNDGTKWISAKGANGTVIVEKQPGKTGTPGLPGTPGGPGAGTNIVINDTGTYIFDPTTNTYTLINAKGDKGDAGVVGVQGLPGTSGTPGKPGSGSPGAPGAGVTIVTNDSGTYVYNPTTEIYTRINGPKGDKGDAGVVGVQGLPGTSGTPGKPGSGSPGAPGAGVTIVTNDSGTYIYNPTTEIYTRINGPKGDKGDAGVVGVQGLPGTSGTPGKPGSGSPGAPGAGVTIVTNDSGTYVYNTTTEIYTRINGPKGDKGDAGAVGSQGSIGATGSTGAAGIGGKTTAGTGINVMGKGSAADPYIINNTVVNTDNQTITDFSVDAATRILKLTLERGNTKTVDLSALSNATSNNGLTKTGINTQLGGALIKPTILTTDATNTLTITGLPVGVITDELVTRNAAGLFRSIPSTSFLPLFTANNGLTKNVPGNTQLGGPLVKPTTITTDATNTLALAGLQPAVATDQILVRDATTGVIKQGGQLPSQLKSFLNYNGSTGFSLLNLTLLGGYRALRFPAAGKQFDENNEYDATTGIFTAKQDGIYNVFIQADSKGLVSAAEFGVGIFKIPAASNTPTLVAEERFLSVNINVLLINLDVSPPTRSTQTLLKLKAGDKIQFGVKLPLATVKLLGSTQSYFTINQVK